MTKREHLGKGRGGTQERKLRQDSRTWCRRTVCDKLIHLNNSRSSLLQRRDQTTIFRLRIGHCGLRAHWKRFGVADSITSLRLQDSRTDRSPRAPGLPPVGRAGKTDVAGGGVHYHQAVGNGGRSAPHRPVPDRV